MTTGAASSGRMMAVYQRPCSARMTALALLRASISARSAARATSTACALRIGGGELGLVGVEEAVDDRRGEKLCEPLQHGMDLVGLSRRGFGALPLPARTRACPSSALLDWPKSGKPDFGWGEGWGEGHVENSIDGTSPLTRFIARRH